MRSTKEYTVRANERLLFARSFQSSQKRNALNLIKNIPDYQIYDVYHFRDQTDVFLELRTHISKINILNTLKQLLYYDPDVIVNKNTSLVHLVLKNFDHSVICTV